MAGKIISSNCRLPSCGKSKFFFPNRAGKTPRTDFHSIPKPVTSTGLDHILVTGAGKRPRDGSKRGSTQGEIEVLLPRAGGINVGSKNNPQPSWSFQPPAGRWA